MVRDLSTRDLRCDVQCKLDLAFFFVIPAVLAATMSLVGGYIDVLGAYGALLYLGALSFVPWWGAGLATAIAHAGLRRYRPPLWILTAIGSLAASVVLIPAMHELNDWFRAYWPGGQSLRELSWPATPDRIREVAIGTGRAIVLWTAFGYVFATTLGWSRYQYESRSSAVPVPAGKDAHSTRFSNSGRTWTEEADMQLAAYVDAGLRPVEIARRMQRTAAAVRIRIAKQKSEAPSPPAR